MNRIGSRGLSVGALACVVLLGLATPLYAQGLGERVSIETGELELNNLIGEIDVTTHEGSAFEVEIRFEGKDAAGNTPQLIREEASGGERLTIKFPEAGKFVYPRLGRGSNTRFSKGSGSDSWLSSVMNSLFGKDIKVSGSGSGLEVWADVEVRVPSGSTLVIRHGVGQLRAEGVEADLTMEVRSGRVGATGIEGDLAVETGSGRIEIERVDGRLTLSTGSGSIDAREIRGAAARIATGSGGVTLEQVDSPSISIATGSGSIKAREISADRAALATGSGSVYLELTRMGTGSFEIGTGSGSVTFKVPGDASMDVHAESGSGGIDLEMTGEMEISRRERDEVRFSVGGGDAKVRIGTGSGGIRIAQGAGL